MTKRVIRLTESDLRRVIKESVEQIISEDLTQQQYAHLAGQADGALSSFGGYDDEFMIDNYYDKQGNPVDRNSFRQNFKPNKR